MSTRSETLSNSSPLPQATTSNSQYSLGDSIYNRLLRERIIWLGSEVRDENANAICAQMMLLAAEDPDKDIWLYINSPGGSVTAGMAIYDTMQYVQPRSEEHTSELQSRGHLVCRLLL